MLQAMSYLLASLLLSLSFSAALAQAPRQLVQQVVDSERAANQKDHSQWVYLEDSIKPKERLLQWVATTPHGGVRRVLTENGQPLSEDKQRERVDQFLHDTHAQNKEIAEGRHDAQQIDDFLKLLPAGFVWTITGATGSTTTLHFVPDPSFHPPTREARVFAAAAGDMVIDNQQKRIRSISGQLIHDVTFGGGLLGRLHQGSSFALKQEQVGPSVWELTSIRVHLQGNALLFKSVSLEQDQERAHFKPEPADVTLEQAAMAVMQQPGDSRSLQTASSTAHEDQGRQ